MVERESIRNPGVPALFVAQPPIDKGILMPFKIQFRTGYPLPFAAPFVANASANQVKTGGWRPFAGLSHFNFQKFQNRKTTRKKERRADRPSPVQPGAMRSNQEPRPK
jgi:hypothetical protein